MDHTVIEQPGWCVVTYTRKPVDGEYAVHGISKTKLWQTLMRKYWRTKSYAVGNVLTNTLNFVPWYDVRQPRLWQACAIDVRSIGESVSVYIGRTGTIPKLNTSIATKSSTARLTVCALRLWQGVRLILERRLTFNSLLEATLCNRTVTVHQNRFRKKKTENNKKTFWFFLVVEYSVLELVSFDCWKVFYSNRLCVVLMKKYVKFKWIDILVQCFPKHGTICGKYSNAIARFIIAFPYVIQFRKNREETIFVCFFCFFGTKRWILCERCWSSSIGLAFDM